MSFSVVIKQKITAEINSLPQKNRVIISEALLKLADNPWPGKQGDKEKLLHRERIEIYRLHIGRSYTAFYTIHEEEAIVRIHNLLTIQQAHKRYGRL